MTSTQTTRSRFNLLSKRTTVVWNSEFTVLSRLLNDAKDLLLWHIFWRWLIESAWNFASPRTYSDAYHYSDIANDNKLIGWYVLSKKTRNLNPDEMQFLKIQACRKPFNRPTIRYPSTIILHAWDGSHMLLAGAVSPAHINYPHLHPF